MNLSFDSLVILATVLFLLFIFSNKFHSIFDRNPNNNLSNKTPTMPNSSLTIQEYKSGIRRAFGFDISDEVFIFQKETKDPLIEKSISIFKRNSSDEGPYMSDPFRRKYHKMILNYYLFLRHEKELDVIFKYQPPLMSTMEIIEQHINQEVFLSPETEQHIQMIFKNFSDELNLRMNAAEQSKIAKQKEIQSNLSRSAAKILSEEMEIVDRMNGLRK